MREVVWNLGTRPIDAFVGTHGTKKVDTA